MAADFFSGQGAVLRAYGQGPNRFLLRNHPSICALECAPACSSIYLVIMEHVPDITHQMKQKELVRS